jgi:hypothetical protein
MTNEAIEAAARAIHARVCDDLCAEISWEEEFSQVKDGFREDARAAAPALMEEGARLALEAAAKEANSQWRAVLDAKDILALSPAAIVKGAGRE